MASLTSAVLLLLLIINGQTPKPAAPFTTPLSEAEMTGKQAVVATTAGTFVIDLRADLAPNHVGYFIKLARAGAYDGTIFHRVVRLGIIQGGDPLSKDPAKVKQYGTGGLGVLKAETSGEKHTRGAVSAVLQPGKPDSAGVAVLRLRDRSGGARRQLHDLRTRLRRDGRRPEDLGSGGRRTWRAGRAHRDSERHHSRYAAAGAGTVRGRVGRRARDASRRPRHRPRVRSPSSSFPTRRPSTSATSCGWRRSGVFDGTSFHRVVQGFVIQTGSLTSRGPLTEKQQKLVRSLPA